MKILNVAILDAITSDCTFSHTCDRNDMKYIYNEDQQIFFAGRAKC